MLTHLSLQKIFLHPFPTLRSFYLAHLTNRLLERAFCLHCANFFLAHLCLSLSCFDLGLQHPLKLLSEPSPVSYSPRSQCDSTAYPLLKSFPVFRDRHSPPASPLTLFTAPSQNLLDSSISKLSLISKFSAYSISSIQVTSNTTSLHSKTPQINLSSSRVLMTVIHLQNEI